jgi:hypothetical protein
MEFTCRLIALFAGLVLGNAIYACFAGNGWEKCIDRSFFQGIALLSVWIIEKMNHENRC